MNIKEFFSNLFSKKEKTELTPSQQKVKAVLNWVVNVACIVLIIFALVVAIFTIIRSTNPDNITRVGDNCYFSVASDSMEPTFKKNDVIIAKAYSGDGSDLQIGQVITFKFNRLHTNGQTYPDFNSHRIIDIERNANGKVTAVRTRGDNQEGSWQDALNDSTSWDGKKVAVEDIVATWGTCQEVDGGYVFTSGKMLKGAGALGNFMQDPVQGKTRFFCIVVLPLILLFVIYAFILVRTLVIAKLENAKKVAGEQVITVDSLSDEEKRRLAQEYLASLGAESAKTAVTAADGEVETAEESGEVTEETANAESEDENGENAVPAESDAE